jgi:ribosomal protein L20
VYQSISKHRRNYLLLFIVLLLAACKPTQLSYEELMTHPVLLAKAMTRCEMDNFTGANCATTQRAQADFSALSNDREKNPIEFGKKIIVAEMHAADLKAEWQIVPTANTKKAYEEAEFHVDCMLAVLKSMFDQR